MQNHPPMAHSPDTLRTVFDLIASGRQAEAVEAASAALAETALPDAERAALLEQRAESRLLNGDFAAAGADAEAIAKLAERSADPAWEAMAHNLSAVVHRRMGDLPAALAAAEAAVEAGQRSGAPVLVARSLAQRGQMRALAGTALEAALADADRAVVLLEQAGDSWYLGRVALSARFTALSALGRNAEADANSRRDRKSVV